MTNYPLGSVIAQRSVTYERKGRVFEVQVNVGAPMKRVAVDAGTEDWYCPFKISGIGIEGVHVAFGIDSVQALHLALVLIGQTLRNSLPGRAGLLSWYGDPNFGFPPPVSIPAPPKRGVSSRTAKKSNKGKQGQKGKK
jgi:hypothetical protein